jgi:hypothetical protein
MTLQGATKMHLPHADQVMHAAEVASFAPVLLALALVTLPVVLPLLLYRWLSGPAGTQVD